MDTIGPIVLALLMFGGYFTPGIIATARNNQNFGAVMVVNLFLGWTLIGWVVALAMAVSGKKKFPANPWYPA